MPRYWIRVLPVVLAFIVTGVGGASGQCLLANPSFELAGSGGAVFAGWNQFGSRGSVSTATHGARAARVTGPNSGGWGVSAFWQRQDTAPGARWSADLNVYNAPSAPLTGECRAIVNIEWRDSSGGLISYESHTVADASAPAGDYQSAHVDREPAPAGTVATHILFGVLQSPTDPAPVVYYDQVTFENLGPPTPDDLQWSDFPGGRTIEFSGRTWRVKGPGYYGPGPNLFCDASSCVWVDANDRLHLTIKNFGGSWYSSEVALQEALGYGDYIFTTVGRLDALDPGVVLGLFLWQYGACYDPAYLWWNPYNEIDIEYSRWGDPGRDVGQFVAQPYDYPGNISRFDAVFAEGELTSHAFRWQSDRVEYRSWRGGPQDESPGSLIHSWTYTGPHIPRPEQPRVHLNLWQFDGPPATPQEVVLSAFTFVPDLPADVPSNPPLQPELSGKGARPNPFRERTVLWFTLPAAGTVEIVICDVSGRVVRTLAAGSFTSGDHGVEWDGRDDRARPVASGIYLARVWAEGAIATQRIVRLD